MISPLISSPMAFLKKRRKGSQKGSKEITFDREIRDTAVLNALNALLQSKKINIRELSEKGCSPLMAITNSDTPLFRIITHIHGDEPQPGEPLLLILSKLLMEGDPRLRDVSYVPRANAEAFRQEMRGVRTDLTTARTLYEAGVLKGKLPKPQDDSCDDDIADAVSKSGITVSYSFVKTEC